MSLFWRVFAANAAILTAGALVLAFAPGPLHKYSALIDLSGLLIGLVVMLAVNGILLRRLFRPLERLAGRMEAADDVQFRDAHAINSHIAFNFDAAGTNYGRVALGLPSENLTL